MLRKRLWSGILILLICPVLFTQAFAETRGLEVSITNYPDQLSPGTVFNCDVAITNPPGC